MMSKKNMLIIAGLAVGGLGVAGLLAEGAGDGGENIQERIKKRAGNILGTTGNGEVGSTVYNIPAQPAVTFPKQEGAFDWGAWLDSQLVGNGENGGVAETPDRVTARRGGGGDFAYAESIPMGADVVPKKKPRMDTPFLTILDKTLGTSFGWTPEAGQAAFERGARQEAEAASYLAGHPTLEMREGVIVKKHVLSPGRGSDFAIAESIPLGGYRGSGMTQSEYKSQFASRTYSTSPTGQAVTPKKYPTATAAQMESTAARRAAFETVTKLSKKQPVK